MAYLVSNDTARWIGEQRRKGNLVGTPRMGHILQKEMMSSEVWVCRILAGDAINGWDVKAYRTMAECRADPAGDAGRDAKIYPCEIGLDSYLPAGTIVLCHLLMCRITGGSENENQ